MGAKEAFEISLADVAQTQLQGKNDVTLEFHVDDTTGANEVFPYMLSCHLWCLAFFISCDTSIGQLLEYLICNFCFSSYVFCPGNLLYLYLFYRKMH